MDGKSENIPRSINTNIKVTKDNSSHEDNGVNKNICEEGKETQMKMINNMIVQLEKKKI